jgi:transposase InsO family protein
MLHALHPDTVVRRHREGFRRYLTRKSRRVGRPVIAGELRALIRTMQVDNVNWGAHRINGELIKLGFNLSEATVSRYMKQCAKPPSQSWRAFLMNNADSIAAVDFFTVPTVTFRVLYVFIIIEHARRHIVHFNVTEHPSAQWAAQQLTEACSFDCATRYLIPDYDAIYGAMFGRRVKSLGIKDCSTAPRSSWQNPCAEPVVGSIRRECLDHVIVLNERHTRRLLKEYVGYYHRARNHLSLNKDSSTPRATEPRDAGNIIAFPLLGGLHHRYTRIAA